MNFAGIRETVIEGSLECVHKGLIHQTSGNISIADREHGIFVITPSSIPYEDIRPIDVPVLSLQDGSVIEGERTPSKERYMHFEIMQKKPKVNAVVHTHSLYATVMSVILEDELPCVAVASSPYTPTRIAPYEVPGSMEIARAVVKAMGDDNVACLLKFHGQITAGVTMRQAIGAAEYVEENAQAAYLIYTAGKMKHMDPDDHKFIHDRALKAMGLL